jgi:hypothetical protein
MKINRNEAVGSVIWSIAYAFIFCVSGFEGVRWIIGGQWLRGLLLICVGCSWSGYMLRVLWGIFTEEH